MTTNELKWGVWAQKPEPIPESEIIQRLDCDVLVLGAGISGVSCALRAAQGGKRVIVMEKGKSWSGRGGNIGVLTSKFMREQGFDNDPETFVREWVKRAGNRCDEEIVWVFARRSGDAMDWLMDILTDEEYHCRPELQGCIYHGETYRELYGSHRFFDGPMHQKGMRAGGADAVYAMYNESCKLGVRYLFNCPACELVKSGARVTGAIGRSENGCVSVSAALGVVIATGDIGGNREMCEDLAPLANRCTVNLYAPKGANTGDGHRLGLWAGGAFEDAPFPTMIHPMAYHFAAYCFLHVDPAGRRFMNEDNYIQGKCIAMLRRGMPYAWSILDADWAEKIARSIPYGGGSFWSSDHAPDEPEFQREYVESLFERSARSGNLVQADTLEELSELMGVPAEEFVRTVNRYNENAANGRDADFGKRTELLMPLDKAPYYALKFGSAMFAVVGGLRVNRDMAVLDVDYDAIPGLYAVGNAAGGRYGVDYPMLLPGNSHGTALTLGFVLGEALGSQS